MNTLTQGETPILSVEAPARLHLGFMDLNGGLGRQFGSLGLAIDGLSIQVHARPAPQHSVRGPHSDRISRLVAKLEQYLGRSIPSEIVVESEVPQHVGLGSGTQLALATGTALVLAHELKIPPRELAPILGRGKRSGIGIGAFERGGFLVDGGHRGDGEVPGITSAHPFPEDWPLLLIFDKRGQGLHGQHELQAFQELPIFPAGSAAELCREVLMRILPALVHRDWPAFCEGVGQVQRVVGDHYASAQGGRFASPLVADALNWIDARGYKGIGQSSWGPTGFAVLDNHSAALGLTRELEQRYADQPDLEFLTVTARNHGAIIDHRAIATDPDARSGACDI